MNQSDVTTSKEKEMENDDEERKQGSTAGLLVNPIETTKRLREEWAPADFYMLHMLLVGYGWLMSPTH